MALAIQINGTAVYGAGAYNPPPTVIPAVSVDPASLGIVQMVGEATSGAPGLTILDNPSQCKPVFGGGALANGALFAFNPAQNPASLDGANDIPGGAFRVQCYKTNQSTRGTLQLPMASTVGSAHNTDGGTSTTTTIEYVASTFTNDQHNGAWLLIGTERRRITDTTATGGTGGRSSLVVSPGFSVAPPNATATTVIATSINLTSEGYGLDQNEIAVEFEASATPRQYILTVSKGATVESSDPMCGTPYMRVMYTGGAVAVGGTGAVTATAPTTTTIEYTAAVNVALNAHAGMVIQLPGGLQRIIASNTAQAAAPGPVVVTYVTAHAITTLQAAACVGGSVTIRDVTSAVATIGSTAMTTTAALAGQSLSLTYSTLGITTIGQLVDYLNANTSYYAELGDGIASSTLLSAFDTGTASNNSGIDVRFDFGVEDVEITGDSASYYAVPLSTWTPNPLKRSRAYQDVMTVVNYINTYSNLVTATRATAGATGVGSYLPAVTGGVSGTQRDVVLWLTGGSRGTSANSNWQTGFDAFLTQRGNSICALIDRDLSSEGFSSTATYASVAAMLQLHIQQRNNGIIKNEAGGYIGLNGTKTQLIAQGRAFNSPNIHLYGQTLTYLDVDGTLTAQPSWSGGCCAAGMRAGGIEVGTPLTKKALRVTAISNDSSWDPNDVQDVNDLTAAGVMFASDTSLIGGVGIRWNRDRTTYVQDPANDIFNCGNMAEEMRFLVYDLRKRLEDRFVGKKNAGGTDNAPPTIASISNAMYEFLDLYRAPPYRILTASVDPDNPSVRIERGFDRVAVRSTGNTTSASFRGFLAPGIDFLIVLPTLAIPTISA